MKKIFIVVLAIHSLSVLAMPHIREFQTTRLNSTAGTGVGSVLSTEAAILNPASAAFFEKGSVSYQSYRASLKNENNARNTIPDRFSNRNSSQALFVSDYSNQVKGGVAYIDQKENHYDRSRAIFHAAGTMGPSSSFGISYNYIADTLPTTQQKRHFTRHQMTLGFTSILTEQLTMGLVMIDPTRATPGEERLLIGFQYQLLEKLTLMADVGTNYTQSFSEQNLWRAAVQLNLFKQLYVRGGKFEDNVQKFRGYGWGLSWIGPRLGVEFAQKFSDQFGGNYYLYEGERLVDTSLSAIINF